MFCYAVYCQETGHPFGHAPIESDAPEFAGFVPTKKQLEYILHIPEFGWSKLNKRTATYQSAWHYLVARNFFRKLATLTGFVWYISSMKI